MKISSDILHFFEKHGLYDADIFNAIYSSLIEVDCNEEEYKNFWGCFPRKNNDILDGFMIVLPYNDDSIETKIFMVETITKAIMFYRNIGKKQNDYLEEAIPMLYSKVFVLELLDTKINKDYNDSLKKIINNKDDKYSFGLYAREKMLNNYKDDLNHLDNITKEAYKEYKRTLKNK